MATTSLLRDRMVSYVYQVQAEIVSALEKFEPQFKFQKKNWKRPGGGGGDSCVLAGGKVFEKAGVNVSVVEGELPDLMVQKFKASSNKFFATGISLVLHPFSPKVPTVHANFRYFEQPDRAWFGGGVDLTPYTVSEEDFQHFHRTLKNGCDPFGADLYPKYKKECDEYFRIQHRDECRGIGGIFFDYVQTDLEKNFEFVQSCGNQFLAAYIPIVERNKDKKFSEREKKFQLLRRGRYVEFNLVYDRGTLFGLQTKGNIESILMSLPAVVHFDYSPDMEATEDEKKLMSWFRSPKEWA
jgi:coproporphyrinogen III oxidase